MFPKLLQVAIALSVFTDTWERNLRSGQIKGIENILRTSDNAKTSGNQDKKSRNNDDRSNEIIGIEPLNSYLNRLANTNKQDRLDNDHQDFNENRDRSFADNLDLLFNNNQDRYDNDNRNRLNNYNRDGTNNDDRDHLFDDNLDRLLNDNQDWYSNDNQDRYDNDVRNWFKNIKRDRMKNDDRDELFDDDQDPSFADNLHRLFNDNQDRYDNDNRNRLNNKKRDRINNADRDRLFDENLDRLLNDNQGRYENVNQNRLKNYKRDRINDDDRDRHFFTELDRLLSENQERYSNDNQDRNDNDVRSWFKNIKRDRINNNNLDRLFNDNQDRFNNDNQDRYNNDNPDQLFDDNPDQLFNDREDRLNNDKKDRYVNDNRNKMYNDNQDRLDNDYQDRFSDDAIETFLRKKSEDLCQKTGRCGCQAGAGRCGESDVEQKTVGDIRNLLDALEAKLNRESRLNELTNQDAIEENTLNARNYVIKLADVIRDVNNIAVSNRNKVRDDRTFDNHVDVVMINDLADIDEVLRQSGLLKSDDLQDVTNNEFVDLTRYDTKPRDTVKAMVLDLGKFFNESGNKNNKFGSERSSSVFPRSERMNPQDFFNLFGTLKEKVTRDLVKYVVSKKAKKPNLNIMNFNQKERISILKGEMRRNIEGKTMNQVRSEVENILFGPGGRIKIVPSDDTDNQVIIPNWMYRIVKDENMRLTRSPKKKRVLPLTNKQKSKLIAKSKRLTPLVGKFWRRNFNQKSQKYGLPFQVALQGLAQYHD